MLEVPQSFGVRRPWIAYVGPFAFPNGGAAACRILGNCQSLEFAGYDVVIASGQMQVFDPIVQSGIWLKSIGERTSENIVRPLRLLRYSMMGRHTRLWLDGSMPLPAAVFLYSGYSPYLIQLTGWCRRHGVPLIFDAVEWYSARSFPHFLTSPYHWNIELAMRGLIKRVDGVVAISSWLADYYRASGLQVVQVPPTCNVESLPYCLDVGQSDKLILTYCGSGGRGQDQLDAVVAAVLQVDPDGSRILLNIAGPSVAEVIMLPAMSSVKFGPVPKSLKLHGAVSHSRSLELVREADFTIFPREINRVSSAGFPTKFVESFASGTPVISTLTSDLHLYLRENGTGLVCADCSVGTIVNALNRALTLSVDSRRDMRVASRKVAVDNFDFRQYSSSLRKLICHD